MKRKTDNNLLPDLVEEPWRPWPVSWSGVWVGTLTALAVLVVIGLIGIAVGAHLVGPSTKILSWTEFGILALAFSVGGAFFSFVAGGWVAARIAGARRADTAMLHGSLAWLVAVPLLIALTALGGTTTMGSWYGGLGGSPTWSQAPMPKVTVVADSPEQAAEAKENAKAARNAALGALTALLLGLVGSAIGGWMASGEPMSLRHYLRERAEADSMGLPGVPMKV